MRDTIVLGVAVISGIAGLITHNKIGVMLGGLSAYKFGIIPGIFIYTFTSTLVDAGKQSIENNRLIDKVLSNNEDIKNLTVNVDKKYAFKNFRTRFPNNTTIIGKNIDIKPNEIRNPLDITYDYCEYTFVYNDIIMKFDVYPGIKKKFIYDPVPEFEHRPYDALPTCECGLHGFYSRCDKHKI
jgi:hypothetical protein